MATNERTICWVESLAEQEAKIHAGASVRFSLEGVKDFSLKSETLGLIREIYFQLELLTRVFNSRMAVSGARLHLAKNETFESFSLSRGRLVLIVQATSPGAVQVRCEKKLSDEKKSILFSSLIEAEFGPFHELKWLFLGEEITAEQLAKHYLTELIQMGHEQGQSLQKD